MHDTLYVNDLDEHGDNLVLRTHTSPVQIHAMLSSKPPFRMAVIGGRVFRHDLDQTHTPMFHQCEGLVIDTKTSLADLKTMIESIVASLFGSDIEMRFRNTISHLQNHHLN